MSETFPSLNGMNATWAVAALFEGPFSIDCLLNVTDMKASQILADLQKGIDEQWIIVNSPGFYTIRSDERQRLRGHLNSDDRTLLHRKIFDYLLSELTEDEKVAEAGWYHLLQIPNDEKTAPWLIKAGDKFNHKFYMEKALACYTKVLDDLSENQEEEADLLFVKTAIKYSKISTFRHDTTRVLSILNAALLRGKKLNDLSYMSLLMMHKAKNEWLCSQYDEALDHFQQGLILAKDIGNPKLRQSAAIFKTFFFYWQGLFGKAIDTYQTLIPEIEKYPESTLPLLAGIIVGNSYVSIGMVSQGIGMLDGILKQCLERGDGFLVNQAEVSLGLSMLQINQIDDALKYLEHAAQIENQDPFEWSQILGKLALAQAYYLSGENDKCVAKIKEFLDLREKTKVNVWNVWPNGTIIMELAVAAELRRLPTIPGLCLKAEVNRNLAGKSVFLKGVAYRYVALMQQWGGSPAKDIIKTLELSLNLLEESGNEIELAKSQLEISRQYLSLMQIDVGRKMALKAYKILSPINENLFPDDLRSLLKDEKNTENSLTEIVKMGQQIVIIGDTKELSRSIISTVNRITGAERGAIFLLAPNGSSAELQLRASKNLPPETVNHASFSESRQMINEVARSGKGKIFHFEAMENANFISRDTIRSCICVPMVFRQKVIGVLYHDNRILSSAFKESDLELLSFFAAQAAIALENAKAYEEIQRLNRRLEEEKQYYIEQHLYNVQFEEIVGKSPAIRQVLAKVDQVSNTDTSVLILGETGVGKELVARAIHRHSSRQKKAFIRVFCSALPDTLIPSELFGHEKGAFTGAAHRRIGRFELADEGTIFLDEIGELSVEIQVRLLSVLQTKEFQRIGGNDTIRSDFRLIVATNRNLESEIKNNRFRRDLFYRINVFPIYVPPLRERKEDIPLLALFFLKTYAQKLGKSFDGINKSEMDKLINYDWPGNIRELENIIERSVILSPGPFLEFPELKSFQPVRSGEDFSLNDFECNHIIQVLQKTGWKIRGRGGSAEMLKIHPSTLAFRMKKLGIKRPPEFSRKRNKLKKNAP